MQFERLQEIFWRKMICLTKLKIKLFSSNGKYKIDVWSNMEREE